MWFRKCIDLDAAGETTTSSLSTAMKLCDADFYPNVYTLLKLLSTTPVTSTEPERVFSQMKLVKSDLRSTMSSERLDHLLTIKIHRDIEIDVGEVINSII